MEAEVVLEHQEFLEYYQPVHDAALSGVQLKGFRPGGAPKDLAEKAINKEKVFEESVNKAVRDSLQEITKENNWQLIDQPKVEVLETNPQANQGLKLKVTLTVFPEVQLGNYQKIVKKVLAEKKAVSVTDQEVEKTVDWVLNSRAKLTRVNREAKKGDAVEIDFSGAANGKPVEGASGKSDQFILGEGKFVPGFEEQIAGHKEGESFYFSVNFPEDYWKEDLRAQKVDFEVGLRSVFEREVPALTDDFAKGLGKFEKAADFRKSVQAGIAKEKEEKENERIRIKILEAIAKNSKIEPPQIMAERTLDNLVAKYKTILKDSAKESELRKSLEEKAKNEVAGNLILYQIAKGQKIEPTKEEVEAEANKLAGKFDPQKVYDYSYGIVQNRKVFEYLEGLK